MEMHSSEDCQKYWRDRFAEQLEESLRRDWGVLEGEPDFQTVKWFREGIKYALIVVRWNYDDEASSDPI
jgi:hypothetical protein